MGLQCTKVTEKNSNSMTSPRVNPNVSQLHNVKDQTTFSIQISNLQLLNFQQTFHIIKIQCQSDFTFQLQSYDFQIHDTKWNSPKIFCAEIKGPLSEIAKKIVNIQIQGKNGNTIDQLKMKLENLSTGPVKHDHLLKSLKSRLLFDCNIDQYLDFDVSLKDFHLDCPRQYIQQDQAFLLSLIFSNKKSHYDATNRYDKHWKIKEHKLDRISLKSSLLNQSVLRVKLTIVGRQEDHLEYYIPYEKIVENSGYKIIQDANGVFERRQFTKKEEIMMKGQKVGTVSFTISITKSKLYVQQMDCVYFSENGIVTTTLSHFQSQQEQLSCQTIQRFLRRLKLSKHQGITDYQFYKIMEELLALLKQGKEFHVNDDLFTTQEAILDFILELQDNIEENKVIKNEYIWKIFNLILHKKIMSLRFFGIIPDEHDQKSYALKYYTFLIKTIIKIIGFISNGISFKEVGPLQKFVAFTYFRLSWVQDEIVRCLSKQSDPTISEDKIAEIGASRRVRSPSKSYVYDWQTNILNLVKKDDNFLKMMAKLSKVAKENPKWAALLFDRQYEQLFYGLYSEVWDEAELFLHNNGRIMWQYFPRYGDLLSIFFGQMNDSGILDFSAEMTRCNMKLIKNQKLLNTFMMLIFPKTCLYQTYSVMKCLDLINCYFLVILQNHKSIPIDFNYNYFYTGIRCILESNHSILLQMMLSILYKYYNIFTKEFKQTLNHYIVNHVFNQLFMHWNMQVRNLFHLLLAFKISKEQIQNPENNPKMSFSVFEEKTHHFDAINQNILGLRDLKVQEKKGKKLQKKDYYLRMKDKLETKRKKKAYKSSFPSCQSLDLSVLGPPSKTVSNFGDSSFQHIPLLARRKWSLAGRFEFEQPAPTEQEIGYLTRSLKQFDEIKRQKFPDDIVEQRSKVLQINIDQ